MRKDFELYSAKRGGCGQLLKRVMGMGRSGRKMVLGQGGEQVGLEGPVYEKREVG